PPELAVGDQVEARHLAGPGLDEPQQIGPITAPAIFCLQMDTALKTALFECQLQLLDIPLGPSGRRAAGVIDQVKTPDPFLEALRQLAASQGLHLILANPEVLAPQRGLPGFLHVMLDGTRSALDAVVAAQHLRAPAPPHP